MNIDHLDAEEREILDDFEADAFNSVLTSQRRQMFAQAARMTPIPAKQSKLINFFNAFADDEAEPLPDDAIFVQGLTFAEFFALSEKEQSTLWNLAHIKTENR